MRAFWWFEENSIAGMARPGFNSAHWFEMSFAEGVLMGWLGQFPSGTASLTAFQHHVQTYAHKIVKFYNLKQEETNRIIGNLQEKMGILNTAKSLTMHTEALDHLTIENEQIHFQFSEKRLHTEMDFLKDLGFKRIATLTEQHHNKEILQKHFELHHFPIVDLEAPKLEQALQLADLIKASQKSQEKLAVHCLAGIGRTSTMIMAAHMAMGENLNSLKEKIARQNPSFVLTGSQETFLHSVAEKFNTV